MVEELLTTKGDELDHLHVDTESVTEYVRSIKNGKVYRALLMRLVSEIYHDNEAMDKFHALRSLMVYENDEENGSESAEVLPLNKFMRVFEDSQQFDWHNAATEFAEAMEEAGRLDSYDAQEILTYEGFEVVVRAMAKKDPYSVLDDSYLTQLCKHLRHEEGHSNKIITIHRAITMPYSVEQFKHQVTNNPAGVGVYWSYVDAGAQTHCGDSFIAKEHGVGGFSVTMTAEVNVQNVDWKQTLHKSLYSLKDEQEIEVKKGATVNIVKFSVDCRDEQELHKSLCDYYLDLDLNPDALTKVLHTLGDSSTVNLEAPVTVRV